MLKPIKNRILCAVSGNHENRSVKDADDDPTYDIMCKLDLEDLYRPNAAFVKIGIGTRPKSDSDNIERSQACYVFAVMHGAGGGVYTGAAVNRNERFGNVIDGLDCLVVGHTHKGTVSKPAKIVVDVRHNKVSQKHYTVINSVSWMSFGGYAIKKMLLPAQGGNPQTLRLSKTSKKITVEW
jgi:hypothetical protein